MPSYVFSIASWLFSIPRYGFLSHFGRTGWGEWVTGGWLLSTRRLAAVAVMGTFLGGGFLVLAGLLWTGLGWMRYGNGMFF